MVITVRVPASTANLGPAFDCLGLALDLWNETTFELSSAAIASGAKQSPSVNIRISGEGEGHLPRDERNLIFRALKHLFEENGQPLPTGLTITCKQAIPLSSGLGSSAAATLTGLLAANALMGEPHKLTYLLQLGAGMEGHADNMAAALHGGLVLVSEGDLGWSAHTLECAPLTAIVVLPELRLSTRAAREALPEQVSLRDAVFNIGRGLQVAEALRHGDVPALADAMQDRLHQPYRLPLIPGAAEALEAARQAGAAAALSGAGPGLIAFVEEGREKIITETLRAPLVDKGMKTRQFLLKTTAAGAQVQTAN